MAVFGLVAPFAAALMLRFGLRKMMAASAVVVAGGMAASAGVNAPWQLTVLWGLVVGGGTGMTALVLGATVANRWFVSRRGLVVGIMTASSATGQLLFLPGYAAIDDAFGWRAVLFAVAVAMLLLVPLILWLMRDDPAHIGVSAYGEVTATDRRPAAAPSGAISAAMTALRVAVRSRDFWLLSAGFFVCGLSTNGLIGTHLIAACDDHGIAEVQAAGLLAMISEAGSVPELRAVNELGRPVLLLDGEELIGAKQNRVLNLTILIPALTALNIPVSCVEAGRWRHTTTSFGAADRTQFARGRARKLVQVSDALASVGSPVAEQGDVWNEIACKSSRMAVHSTTQAMAALFEHAQNDVDGVVASLETQSEQVGAIFLIGDQITGMDAFGHAETYAKLSPKILRSYALDAIDSASNGPALSDQALTAASATFLADLGRSMSRPRPALGLGEDIRLSAPGLAGAMLAVNGAAVHLVAFPQQTFADSDPE